MAIKTLTTEKFIKDCKLTHGDKYDYSKVDYVHYKQKIIIICKIHGEFLQSPHGHKHGAGCMSCGKDKSESKLILLKEFIKNANIKHDNKYDYSKSVYDKISKDILVICPKHGEFDVNGKRHLNGLGCKKCESKNYKLSQYLSTDEYIEKAIAIHGNKYNYDKVKYIDSHTKIEIICPIHGSFLQRAEGHLNKGCKKCHFDTKKFTTEQFITISNLKHDFKYDYSLVKYDGNRSYVDIICPKHNIFSQKAQHHMDGMGCRKCKGMFYMTLDEFIVEANLIHNGKYDYTNSVYTKYDEPIEILCPTHGIFHQRANVHLDGSGCKLCVDRPLGYTTETYIDAVKLIHKNKYDYSETIYTGALSKLKIICPEHGLFHITGSGHLEGRGCIECGRISARKHHQANSWSWTNTSWHNAGINSKNFTGFKVYILKCWNDDETFYKIGKTFVNIKERFKGKGMPYNYEIIKIFNNDVDGIVISDLEHTLHKKHNDFRYVPIKSFGGQYECFTELKDISDFL
jgi:hypothetical protein